MSQNKRLRKAYDTFLAYLTRTVSQEQRSYIETMFADFLQRLAKHVGTKRMRDSVSQLIEVLAKY
jgi:hypothetical protein